MKRKERITLSIDPRLKSAAATAAKREGVSVSAYMEGALLRQMSAPDGSDIERVMNLGLKRVDRTLAQQSDRTAVLAELVHILLTLFLTHNPRIEDEHERAIANEQADERAERALRLVERRLSEGGLFARLGTPVETSFPEPVIEDDAHEPA